MQATVFKVEEIHDWDATRTYINFTLLFPPHLLYVTKVYQVFISTLVMCLVELFKSANHVRNV